MKMLFAILLCKVIRFIGKIVNKGSSLPGKVALKIDPNILSKIKFPSYVVAVTGSNGKTSTVEMIFEILATFGLKVACNIEGSNQIEGVTTFLLENCSLSGVVDADVVLIEMDERYARHTFKFFSPTHYVITNLYRDQLTRNGHPEWIYNILKDSIHDETLMILNADDPLVNSFEVKKAIYFGLDNLSNSTLNNAYNDGICPKCKNKLIYESRYFNHIGRYKCFNCNYLRNDTKYQITNIDLNKGFITFDEKNTISLAFKSMYNAYNILAAYSLAKELNINDSIIVKALNNYILKNGRVKEFRIGNNFGTLLLSKHENSISYNQSLQYITNQKKYSTVLIMVDAVSRKYFTSETSWLWDIDFELLNTDSIKEIIITGLYSDDVALRLQYAGIDFSKVNIYKKIPEAINYLKNSSHEYIYVVTCFSDEGKLLNKVEVY